MRTYSFVQPKTMDELFKAVSDSAGKAVRFVAGGTDFMPRLHTDLDSIPTGNEPETAIISLVGLGIDKICETGDAVKIGACAILNDIAGNDIVKKEIPALSQTIDACGIWVESLPATPEKILRLLEEKEGK